MCGALPFPSSKCGRPAPYNYIAGKAEFCNGDTPWF